MMRKSDRGSCANDARDQEWVELEDMEQERRSMQTKKQEVYHQWNNYHDVLLFWRCQEARQTSAQPPTPQTAAGGLLVAKNSLSILHVHKKRGIFTKSSAQSPWKPTETRRELSDACPKSGQHEDTTSFFEALESSADQLEPYEKVAGLLTVTAKQSWALRLRPLWLLMALACIAYVIVSAVNVYLAPPLSKPDALPLPIFTNHNEEGNSKEELGKSSESEKLCDWDCLSYLWN